MKIKFYTASSRFAKSWYEVDTTWQDFVNRLREPIRSTETLAEFLALNKDEQMQLKDVGGYVGGVIKGNRRTAQAIESRTLITLDIDFARPDTLDKLIRQLLRTKYKYCIHSTRKHQQSAPRLRLILPLAEPVDRVQYECVSRHVARELGVIDLLDITTYAAERLMFWPSVSKDSEYVFEEPDDLISESYPVDANKILASYSNYKDAMTWARGVNEAKAHAVNKETIDKQQDPTTKEGVIGAFCRTYSISEAINKYLDDVYQPFDESGSRYTYVKGSTEGGAITYDDKFLYSHHGTDPASLILCNSFDLVRIHKFGHLDKNVEAGADTSTLKSYKKMINLALEDEGVKREYQEERKDLIANIFPTEIPEGMVKKEDSSWTNDLKYRGDQVQSTTRNITIILQNDPNLKERIAFDEFSNRVLIDGAVPWAPKDDTLRDWTDADDASLRVYLETLYGISGVQKISDALVNVSMLKSFHNVKSYLNGLKWDGVERLDTLLIDYFGCVDDVYSRSIMRKLLVAAVTRIFNPGAKFDYMPILVGPQGCGKSTFLYRLGREWYSDSLYTFEGKEAAENIQGAWLIEVGELNSFSRSEVNAVKQFLSKPFDIYRAAYGRRNRRYPRQCVFVGTTNDDEFLRDKTGNRRFWPINLYPDNATKDIFNDFNELIVDQVWAEAIVKMRAGEQLHMTGEAARRAQEEQEAHMEYNPKEGIIREYLDMPVPANWSSMTIPERRLHFDLYREGKTGGDEVAAPRDRICVAEIWVECFGYDIKNLQRRDTMEINGILKGFKDWEQTAKPMRFGKAHGKQRGFMRKGQIKGTEIHI